jgi:bile acid:Na+ symporter, BASS family
MSPDAVARVALLTLLLPLFLGVAVRQMVPDFARDVAKPLGFVATLLLLVSGVALLLKLAPAAVSLIGDGTLVAMIAFVLIGLTVGHFLGGPAAEDRSALALATASRHPGIAIAIAHVNFPGEPLVPAAVVLYMVVSSIVSTPYVKRSLRSVRRSPKPAMRAGGAGVRVPR